ncbi:hypothetical protein RB195_006625 [Necator americanus]
MWLCLFAILPILVDGKALATTDTKDNTCSFETENYSLSWTYDDPSSDMVFKIVARSKMKNFWAGFFMGDDQPEDSIGAFVRNGQIGLMDAHTNGSDIHLDNITNVQALLFDLQDDTLTAEFARPISSNDPTDADLTECITLFFPNEVLEMDSDGELPVPNELHRKRICDLPTKCSNRDRSSGLVKRSDASVCEHTQGKSTVRWKTVGNDVMFSIGQSVEAGKWWSSVGIGPGMLNLTMAIAFLEDGMLRSLGGYRTQGYGMPRRDLSVTPRLNEMGTKVSNERSFVQFSLPMEIFNENMDDSGCVTLQIATLAGEWFGDYTIRKHDKTPEAVLVCGIDQCRDSPTVGNQQSQPTTVQQPNLELTQRPESSGEEESRQKNVDEQHNVALNKEESEGSTGEDVKEDINERGPVVSRLLNEVDSSGTEPANETSVFASAGRAVDALPEGSGSEASAEGEISKVIASQDDEILTTVPNSVAGEDARNTDGESVPKMGTVDGEAARGTSPSPELLASQTGNSGLPAESGQISNFPVTTPLPSAAEAVRVPSQNQGASGIAHPSISSVSNPVDEMQTTPTTLSNVTITMGRPLVLSKTVSPAVANILRDGCSDGHTDLRVCESYFADYLGKVKEWADRHNQVFGQQMWKACKLLSEVKHVPTMCCEKFRSTCVGHLQTNN